MSKLAIKESSMSDSPRPPLLIITLWGFVFVAFFAFVMNLLAAKTEPTTTSSLIFGPDIPAWGASGATTFNTVAISICLGLLLVATSPSVLKTNEVKQQDALRFKKLMRYVPGIFLIYTPFMIALNGWIIGLEQGIKFSIAAVAMMALFALMGRLELWLKPNHQTSSSVEE